MLWNLCVFALLAAQALSSSNYFVGLFEASYKWAYPVNMCVLSGIPFLSFGYVKYTCSMDGSWVNAQTYSSVDTTCSTPLTSMNYTAFTVQDNGLYAFNCYGTNDYMESKLIVGSCLGSITATVYSAVNTCFKISSTNLTTDIYEEAQCNSTASGISIYASVYPTCNVLTGAAFLQTTSYITTTCAKYITSPTTVNAKLLDCVYNGYSNFPMMKNNSDLFTGTEVAVKGYEVMIIAWAASEFLDDPMVCSFDWFLWLSTYFTPSMVVVKTTCNSHEGIGYQSIVVDTDVTVYDIADVEDCLAIETGLAMLFNMSNITNVGMNMSCIEYDVTMPPTTTSSSSLTTTMKTVTTTAPASILTINYLIVFAISCFAAMYI